MADSLVPVLNGLTNNTGTLTVNDVSGSLIYA